jgi:hypothetical protein
MRRILNEAFRHSRAIATAIARLTFITSITFITYITLHLPSRCSYSETFGISPELDMLLLARGFPEDS